MNEVAKKNADEIKKLPPRKIWENHYFSMHEFDCRGRCHDLIFVAQKGLSTFFVNKVNIFSFLFGSSWNPAAKEFGALPMILGSFIVTLLSALLATPFAIGAAVS